MFCTYWQRQKDRVLDSIFMINRYLHHSCLVSRTVEVADFSMQLHSDWVDLMLSEFLIYPRQLQRHPVPEQQVLPWPHKPDPVNKSVISFETRSRALVQYSNQNWSILMKKDDWKYISTCSWPLKLIPMAWKYFYLQYQYFKKLSGKNK